MTTLVTGANRGIGFGLARGFAARGEPVIATSRHGAPVGTPLAIEWQDLTTDDPASPGSLAKRLAGRSIDLLVCNAGVYLDKGQKLESGFDAALWSKTFAVNVAGVFLTIRALLPNLRLAGGAKIAIISSKLGSQSLSGGGSYIYRSSKAAAVNLGRNLAVDLKPEGIAVGIYHPGWVRTDMGGSGGQIDTATAAAGLMERFAALSVENTGCFQSYDGSAIPF